MVHLLAKIHHFFWVVFVGESLTMCCRSILSNQLESVDAKLTPRAANKYSSNPFDTLGLIARTCFFKRVGVSFARQSLVSPTVKRLARSNDWVSLFSFRSRLVLLLAVLSGQRKIQASRYAEIPIAREKR